MNKLQEVLLATDFHPEGKLTTQVATDLAWKFGSAVTLIHVTTESGSPVSDNHRRTISRAMLDQLAEELRAQKIEVRESVVVTGSVADRILQKASEMNADLILLGAGRQIESGPYATVGPTAATVMEHAHQPVMTVVPAEASPTFRRILCPVDFSATSQRGLANAIRLARAFHGHLVVGTVFPSGGWLDSLASAGTGFDVDAKAEEDWRSEFDTLVRRTDFDDVPFITDVRRGVPHEQISAIAVDHKCDVIVMGATGRTGLARLLMGSVTRRVLRKLPCSVLVVHGEDVLINTVSDDDLRNSQLLYAEGEALLKANDFEVAIRKFDQVLRRNPYFVEALEGRAIACDKLGYHERAANCRRHLEVIRREISHSVQD